MGASDANSALTKPTARKTSKYFYLIASPSSYFISRDELGYTIHFTNYSHEAYDDADDDYTSADLRLPTEALVLPQSLHMHEIGQCIPKTDADAVPASV